MSDIIDLSKFTKKDKIGQGAFGKVYKIQENSSKNIYVAKFSRTKFLQYDQSLITDLKREISIISQLNHPSVLKFIGYSPYNFKHEYCPVILTELLPNGSLDDILQLERNFSSPRMWTDTKKLINIYGIASAMSYLHSFNIIHRDLKPANILEDESLYPKICDFGLSKFYHNNFEGMTSQKEGVKGTPIYTAPEIFRSNEYTKAGDVYSFSMIVYELLTLSEPFKDLNIYMMYSKVVINGERPKFEGHIPFVYKNLITRCWSSSPTERPTFNEIVEELRTNKDFILETIDENEYMNYIDYIDDLGSTFNKSNQIKLKIEQRKNEDEEEEEESTGKINELKNIFNNKSMTVESFNCLVFKYQKEFIYNLNENNGTRYSTRTIVSIFNFFKYFEEMKINEDSKYFSVSTKDDDLSFEESLEEFGTISISHRAIEIIYEKSNIDSKEIEELIENMKTVIIEIKYPSPSFDLIYTEIIKLKERYEKNIKISIFISGINQTDMKFRFNKNITSIIFDDNVNKITGEPIGFDNEGGGSFRGCSSLIQVIMTSSITLIGNSSFSECTSLTEINIPSSVIEIEDSSFCGCSSLIEITIPSSVTSIGNSVFEGCSSLAQIIIPSSLTKIGNNAFEKCSSLTQIKFPSSCSSIENSVFKECSSLRQITIPDSVTSIGDNAFENCLLLTHIVIPSSCESIGDDAFSGCLSLVQIKIPSSVISIKGGSFTGVKSLEIIGDMKTIFSHMFDRCSSLTQITIPSSVTEIGDYAFKGCSSLTQITIPSSVTSIGKYVFEGCSSLTQITIPSSVTSIGNSVFEECSSLAQIIIPSSVTSIGDSAFKGCSSLIQITIPSSVTSIGDSAFKGCSSLIQITIPSSVTSIGDSAFYECSSLTEIEIPSLITSISEFLFTKCSSMLQITIPDSVTSIDSFSFARCFSLKKIKIPPSVTSIGSFAFIMCKSLSHIEIPSSVTSIGDNAFSGCSSLTQITIPSSVTSIGENAFYGCSSLTQITIPSSLKIDNIGLNSNVRISRI